MTWSRFVAILVATAVSFTAGQLFGLNWYVSFAIGVFGYFLTRYALWAVAERRRFKNELAQVVKDYHEK
jgi:Flp pilus assembly protein TadB